MPTNPLEKWSFHQRARHWGRKVAIQERMRLKKNIRRPSVHARCRFVDGVKHLPHRGTVCLPNDSNFDRHFTAMNLTAQRFSAPRQDTLLGAFKKNIIDMANKSLRMSTSTLHDEEESWNPQASLTMKLAGTTHSRNGIVWRQQ